MWTGHPAAVPDRGRNLSLGLDADPSRLKERGFSRDRPANDAERSLGRRFSNCGHGALGLLVSYATLRMGWRCSWEKGVASCTVVFEVVEEERGRVMLDDIEWSFRAPDSVLAERVAIAEFACPGKVVARIAKDQMSGARERDSLHDWAEGVPVREHHEWIRAILHVGKRVIACGADSSDCLTGRSWVLN